MCGAAGCVWTRANCGYVDSVLDGNACNTKIVYKGMGRAYRSGRREWWVSEWCFLDLLEVAVVCSEKV